MDTLPTETNEFYNKRFVGLNCSEQTWSAKEFEECEFKGCDLSAAKVANCKFIDCRFAECNLSLLKVTSSKFREVVFEDCKAIGINWTQATWQKLVTSSPLKFRKCILNDSSFFGLTLEEFVAEECKARDVDFRECKLNGAKFGYTDFSGSSFGKTSLCGADFAEALNYDIDVLNNELKGAKFTRSEAVRLLQSLDIELLD